MELPKNATENSVVTVKAKETKLCRPFVTGNCMTGVETRGIPPAIIRFKVFEHSNSPSDNIYNFVNKHDIIFSKTHKTLKS